MSSDDDQQEFTLIFLLALIGLVLSVSIGVALWHQGGKFSTFTAAPPAPKNFQSADSQPQPAKNTSINTEPTALAPEAVILADEAAVYVDGEVVKFFFAWGKADIAPGAEQALEDILLGLADGQRAQISGFHDATGDPQKNQRLAKRRAQAVQQLLIDLGANENAIELLKPEETLASGTSAQARRVEVRLIEQ